MDTQRLILFVIFSFSALFLWEAWQREHRPPPPPPPATAAKPATPADLPAPSMSAPGQGAAPGAVPVPATPGTTADAGDAAAARPLVVKTDLYTADIELVGGAITRVALDAHRDVEHGELAYTMLVKNAERTFVAQSGLLGSGLPNHRTVYEALPGPRELAPGADTLEVRLQA